MAIDNPIPDPTTQDRPYKLPRFGGPSHAVPGVKPASPALGSGPTSFSARGAAKPVATGVNATPAPALPRPALTAHSAGAATASALGTGLRAADTVRQKQVRGTAGLAAGLVDGASAPWRRAATGMVNFGRGLFGLDAQPFDATPTQDMLARVAPSVYGLERPAAAASRPTATAKPTAAPVPRPASAVAAAPVVNPAGPATGVSAPDSVPTGGIPAPPPAPPAPVPRPGDPNTFTGTNGVTRAIATDAPLAGTAMGSVTAQSFGGSVPAATVTPAAPALAMPRAPDALMPVAQNASRSGEVRDMRAAALSEIGSQLFQLRGQNTRSSRAAIGDLLGAQAGLVNTAATVDGSLAGGNRDAAMQAGAMGAAQQGENQRAALKASNDLQQTQLVQQGAAERKAAALAVPRYFTDESGEYRALGADGIARPVLDPSGAPVRPASPENELAAKDILDAYSQQYEATLASVPIGQDATPYLQQFGASPIAEAYRAVLAGNLDKPRAASTPPIGAVRAGYRFKGGNPADRANWEKVAP